MADTGFAKNFNIKCITGFPGYNSSLDKTNIAPNFLVFGSLNVYKKLSGTIAVRPGLKRQGTADSTQSPVSSEFIWNTSWGATIPIWVSNSKLQIRFNDVWYTILDSLTQTRYVFDKWWDNTEKKDRVLFVNGTDDMFSWSGGVTTAAAQGAGLTTLVLQNAGTWQGEGFSTTVGQKKFHINGDLSTEYTYTGGESTNTLTGISPNLPAISAGTVILQSVITHTNTPASGFNSDFIKVINNQAYVGSYVSRLCYISSNSDYTNYTVPTPRAAGDPELLTLDDTLKGIGVRQGKAHIGIGSGGWAVVSFSDITVGTTLTQQTNVDVKPVALLQAPLAHEFIDTVGDNLVYLAQDYQVRTFADLNNAFTPRYPSLSQEIATELEDAGNNGDFESGGLRCIGEFIYVTAPATGKVYLRQDRERVDQSGQTVKEILWHAPFVWNATRVDQIDGTVVAFSNANPQVYECWNTNQYYDDSPSDEPLPYYCAAAFAYRTTGENRAFLQSFDKPYTEGYVTQGTPLNLTINYDFEGSRNIITVPINSTARPAYLFSTAYASLGDSSLGDEPLGDGITIDPNTLLKFKNINSVNLTNTFEWQPIYFSEVANARWELLAVGSNTMIEPDQQPTFLINKLR